MKSNSMWCSETWFFTQHHTMKMISCQEYRISSLFLKSRVYIIQMFYNLLNLLTISGHWSCFRFSIIICNVTGPSTHTYHFVLVWILTPRSGIVGSKGMHIWHFNATKLPYRKVLVSCLQQWCADILFSLNKGCSSFQSLDTCCVTNSLLSIILLFCY